MSFLPKDLEPGEPTVMVGEDVERDEYGDPIGGPKISKKEKEKNLKKNEKDEDHTTTTTEGRLRYGNYGNYVDGQKREVLRKEYINPKKLPVANASYEPNGETISEEEEEKKNPTFVQFMKRIDQLPEFTREAIKNCGNDPAIAKAALEISGIDK